MVPIDLSKQPPRSCRTEIDGIPFVARAIDKTRAELPGGNLGVFFSVRSNVLTMSAFFYRSLGITHEQFVAVISESADDKAVAGWLREHADPAAIEKFKKQLLSLRLADLPPATLTSVCELYPNAKDTDLSTLMIDVIDQDDCAMFA
jgi:hypothetical protein